MSERMSVSGEGPGDFPEYQSPELITRLVEGTKIGDVVYIVPRDEKLEYLINHLGLSGIFACVSDKNTKKTMMLQSECFTYNLCAFGTVESRTYSPKDIRLIEIIKAEKYIPKASEGRFTYLSEATVKLHGGLLDLIKVDSYFNGIVSGINLDGVRIGGSASLFRPH